MSTYLLRNIPTDVHRRLRKVSKESGISMRHMLLKGAERFMEQYEQAKEYVIKRAEK